MIFLLLTLGIQLATANDSPTSTTELYVLEDTPPMHRVDVWFRNKDYMHCEFAAASTTQLILRKALARLPCSWGLFAMSPKADQTLTPLPANLSSWKKLILAKLRLHYPAAKNIQISYRGKTKAVHLLGFLPPIGEGTHGDLDEFFRIQANLREDGSIDNIQSTTFGKTKRDLTLKWEIQRFPKLRKIGSAKSPDSDKNFYRTILADETFQDPSMKVEHDSIVAALEATPVAIITKAPCVDTFQALQR